MELTWQDMLRLYAPYIAYALIVALGGIYAFGYRNGIQSIMIASAKAGNEARCGL